jgi:hypothetical protein
MWYVEVALVHGCHLPVHLNVQSVKTYQPLSSYIYREAVRLFNIFYRIKNSLDAVVVDCPDYCHLNGLTGKIQCFNKQTGQYIVAINSSGHCSSGSATVVVHLCPYYMQPLYQVTEPGIKISCQVKDEEVVSISNIFSVSETTNSQICVKFHWQVFNKSEEDLSGQKIPLTACLVRLFKMNYLNLHTKLEFESNMLFLIKWNTHPYFQMVKRTNNQVFQDAIFSHRQIFIHFWQSFMIL